MKVAKLITLLALLALTLTGCTNKQINTDDSELSTFGDRIISAEYKDHSYIIYKGIERGGITHDPDCPCREKGGEDE